MQRGPVLCQTYLVQIDLNQLIWVEVSLAELQVFTASETATGQIISFFKPKHSKMGFGLENERVCRWSFGRGEDL